MFPRKKERNMRKKKRRRICKFSNILVYFLFQISTQIGVHYKSFLSMCVYIYIYISFN